MEPVWIVVFRRWAIGVVILGSAAMSYASLIANFDNRIEGEGFDAFSNGGIRFHNVWTHGGGSTNFTIENASGGFLGPGVSYPNVLGFGAYVPGPEVAFGGIASFRFTSDSLATTAGLDVWVFQGELGINTLALRGYRSGQVVHSVDFSFEWPPTPLHRRLDLPVGEYDGFELYSWGQAFLGDSTIVVDNVTVEAVPEPASVAGLALGVFAALRRKRH